MADAWSSTGVASSTASWVSNPIIYLPSSSPLGLQWSFRDTQSAIASYSLSLIRVMDDSASPPTSLLSSLYTVIKSYGSIGQSNTTSITIGLQDIQQQQQLYRYCIQAINNARLSTTACSPSVSIDNTPPTAGVVVNGPAINSPVTWYSPSQPLQVSVTNFTDASGIDQLVWCVGSSAQSVDDVLPCSSIGLNQTAQSTAASAYFASLSTNSSAAARSAPFYHVIKAYDLAGWSTTVLSAPVTVDLAATQHLRPLVHRLSVQRPTAVALLQRRWSALR